MTFFRYIPCLAFLLVFYNIGMLGFDIFHANISVLQIPLPHNGDSVLLTKSDVFAMIGIICLYFEVLKSTRTSRDSIIDHILSVGVLMVCIIEFLIVPGAGTTAFMFLTLLSFIDVISGFTVTFAASRRDINIGGNN